MNVVGGISSVIVMMFIVCDVFSVLVVCVSSIVLMKLVSVIVRKCSVLWGCIVDEKFYSVFVRYENVVV